MAAVYLNILLNISIVTRYKKQVYNEGSILMY